MSKHSHISAIFDNAFQSRAGSPDVYMSMIGNNDREPILQIAAIKIASNMAARAFSRCNKAQ